MKKVLKYPLLVLFTVFIAGFTILDFINPPRTHSEFESNLTQKPKFSVETLLNGKYTLAYENYVNDQFFLRDQWITLKSYAESALSKVENNGIVYGKDGFLFEKLTSLDEKRFNTNIEAVKSFCEKYPDANVSLAIIPNSYAIHSDKLPVSAPLIDQEKLINEIYTAVSSANKIDMLFALKSHSDEYIYYRTDHHWTTLGAYYGYQALCQSLGLDGTDIGSLTSHTVEDFYGTFFSKAKAFNIKPDTITYYDVPASIDIMTADPQTAEFVPEKSFDTLYDLDKFDTRDKYAAFIHSNNGLSIIRNEGDYEKERILVIKDSYSNSLLPFLSLNYKEIVVVDLRYIFNVSMVMDAYDFDDVLIAYNLSTFTGDTDIVKMKY